MSWRLSDVALTHTRLFVDDYTACFRFYRDTLDLTPSFGDETSGDADFETGRVSLASFDRESTTELLTRSDLSNNYS